MLRIKYNVLKYSAIMSFVASIYCNNAAAKNISSFEEWVEEFRRDAVVEGLSPQLLDSILSLYHSNHTNKVINNDRNQPEAQRDFNSYINNSINTLRINKARKAKEKHFKLLNGIEKKFGVHSEILIAFWALETDFGRLKGNIPLINSLIDLAYDTRRPDFFKAELIHALKMIQSGIDRKKMVGSWAGAFGNFQFMPSTFRKYAVDYDKDGVPDLWDSFADALASAANYLHSVGWNIKEGWGQEVILPKFFDSEYVFTSKPLREWEELGFKLTNKLNFESKESPAKLIIPAGIQGPAFLVYKNFDVIMDWNYSILYALSVGLLSDLIEHRPVLNKKYNIDNIKLSHDDAKYIQEILKNKRYYKGQVDGILGIVSRKAIRQLQRDYNVFPDGFVTQEFLKYLKSSDENKDNLTKDEIKYVQKILKEKKYYKGKVDGKIGKNTRKAVDLFKAEYNITTDSDKIFLINLQMHRYR
ncbi:MAG: lytic murein transglycosylase [Alphaproteobacteria bacterium]|nr:lytic murein transglycosylase [Alphaproteobacteria bacterium]